MVSDEQLEKKFGVIVEFLQEHQDRIPRFPGKEARWSESLREKLRVKFLRGREIKHPTKPMTVTDDAYLEVMFHYWGFGSEEREKIEEIHKAAMAAENIVGDILERYLAERLESEDWVWCSGSVVRATDFIRYENGRWRSLQIKNRDNSENSSSSAIRAGTEIEKWFRCFSQKPKTNWDAFPYQVKKGVPLSDDDFKKFLIRYVEKIRVKK